SVLKVARRVTSGDFDVEPIKITVPEGTSVRGITELLKEVPDFDTQAFYELAQDKEGRLFPDTYFILPGEDPALVLQRFEDNFKAQVTQTQVALAVSAFGRPFEEVVVMASLLEKEANNSRDRRLIAGILWSRIELGIPLQVDAVFPYIIGKGSHNLSRADLRTDSPYNTYTNKGLPPGAITNPGLSAILDAVTPIETDYLFYLADRGGTTHYSVTYEQHLNNRAKYLGS
ncbi:MAG: endolytic transglycosylase MltG, partial [Patescibacteria group bacterium]|nr:endolytic transglycosylase MltG [Patescibacteria group bacterium]